MQWFSVLVTHVNYLGQLKYYCMCPSLRDYDTIYFQWCSAIGIWLQHSLNVLCATTGENTVLRETWICFVNFWLMTIDPSMPSFLRAVFLTSLLSVVSLKPVLPDPKHPCSHEVQFIEDFLDMTSKAQSIKEKIDRMPFIKTKKFCSSNTLLKENEKTSNRLRDYIFKQFICKGLLSRIYKNSKTSI